MLAYLDMAGKIQTPKAGLRELDVPLVQMNARTGFVADALIATIPLLGLDRDRVRRRRGTWPRRPRAWTAAAPTN